MMIRYTLILIITISTILFLANWNQIGFTQGSYEHFIYSTEKLYTKIKNKIEKFFFKKKAQKAIEESWEAMHEDDLKFALKKKIPNWFTDQINDDFSFITTSKPIKLDSYKFTEQYIINNKIGGIARVKIINNKIYYKIYYQNKGYDDRYDYIFSAILKAGKYVKFPDVDFFICTKDSFKQKYPETSAPIFAFAINKNLRANKILIPDALTLMDSKLSDEIRKINNEIPWDSKIDKAFWRGSTTGWIDGSDDSDPEITIENYSKFPRFKLVEISEQYQELLDAKFVNFVHMNEATKNYIATKFALAPSANKLAHLSYKIQINIDGNSSTYPGFLWRLLSNSVVLKQETEDMQWFYNFVKPMIHYVPVKSDLSDLIEKIHWIKSHDQEAKIIAENATKFVNENLTIADIHLYIYILLKNYSQIIDFQPEIDASYIEFKI
ncbi:MAG: glycosyl transferase family 90 [Rickettsiaceae bacterium]|nr:glycosyl transferase family 90 [Rickettsiaceae bacterium]